MKKAVVFGSICGWALLASSAFAAAPDAPVFSSDARARAEYAQFGGPLDIRGFPTNCSSDPCTIYAGSPAVLSVNWIEAGVYIVNFAPNTWAEPPTCTATLGISDNFAAPAFPLQWNRATLTEFFLAFVQTVPNETPFGIDQSAHIICLGHRP